MSAVLENDLYCGSSQRIEVINNNNFNLNNVVNLGQLNIQNTIPLNLYSKTYNTYYTLQGVEEIINGTSCYKF